MADYIRYHDRIKENLSRFRDFNDESHDGESPERVIFSNDENMYYGTFKGSLTGGMVENSEIEDCSLSGCTLEKSELLSARLDGAEMHDVLMHTDVVGPNEINIDMTLDDIAHSILSTENAVNAIRSLNVENISDLSSDSQLPAVINAVMSVKSALSALKKALS